MTDHSKVGHARAAAVAYRGGGGIRHPLQAAYLIISQASDLSGDVILVNPPSSEELSIADRREAEPVPGG